MSSTPNEKSAQLSGASFALSIIALFITWQFYEKQTALQEEHNGYQKALTQIGFEQSDTNKRLLRIQEELNQKKPQLRASFESKDGTIILNIENDGNADAKIGTIYINDISILDHPLFIIDHYHPEECYWYSRIISPQNFAAFETRVKKSRNKGGDVVQRPIKVTVFYDGPERNQAYSASDEQYNNKFETFIEFPTQIDYPPNYPKDLPRIVPITEQGYRPRSRIEKDKDNQTIIFLDFNK